MKAKYAADLSGVSIKTPWENFDHLINGWMKYAAHMGSRWARVRHNGYRDMTSDTECLGCVNPKLAWERMKRVLTYQYQNGYAPRTFADGRIKDNNFADNTVWMTYAVNTIIKELGDPNLLYEKVKFNDTEEEFSVYEHIRRSVDFLYNFQGNYGLVRIWGGDWNDCINYAGLKGKGVSVWLSIAWVRAGKMFAEVARMLGKEDDAKLAMERVADMTAKIEKYGFDEKGGYYIYARTMTISSWVPLTATRVRSSSILRCGLFSQDSKEAPRRWTERKSFLKRPSVSVFPIPLTPTRDLTSALWLKNSPAYRITAVSTSILPLGSLPLTAFSAVPTA